MNTLPKASGSMTSPVLAFTTPGVGYLHRYTATRPDHLVQDETPPRGPRRGCGYAGGLGRATGCLPSARHSSLQGRAFLAKRHGDEGQPVHGLFEARVVSVPGNDDDLQHALALVELRIQALQVLRGDERGQLLDKATCGVLPGAVHRMGEQCQGYGWG